MRYKEEYENDCADTNGNVEFGVGVGESTIECETRKSTGKECNNVEEVHDNVQ